jgi:hypothetical protein
MKTHAKEKLNKILNWRYFEIDSVKSLTTFFGVPNGDADMPVVYDGTVPGLNLALPFSWFMLANTNSHLRTVDPDTFMGDVDIAEMFLKLFLDWHFRKYAGDDLMSYFGEDLEIDNDTFWVLWGIISMGIVPSPYYAVQIMAWLDETVFGDHTSVGSMEGSWWMF